ncbi:MAG: L,D-transpeptidase, partial [Polyangiaceae bacterium]|nr:L,D-transpeptidase [Polyangiaceae bacterium]
GEKDTTGRQRKGRATWIEASILGGWLVAFEGTRPVYATMISAGRGGAPHQGKKPIATASTPVGRFGIGGKFRTATMDSSSTPIVHADVPWTQNFSGPHAIHSAYWHNDWGQLKSAGCVNVSPRDGRWLFEFSEPDVPEDWHGVRYNPKYGGSTLLILHK